MEEVNINSFLKMLKNKKYSLVANPPLNRIELGNAALKE